MNQQTDRQDRLVEDYLGAVSYACADLSPQHRDELVEDLREHITAARAVLYEPTEAAVRTILDRLGEPSAIAAEARLADPFAQPPAPRMAFAPVAATHSREVTRSSTAATLGVLLGFVLIIMAMLVIGTVLMLR